MIRELFSKLKSSKRAIYLDYASSTPTHKSVLKSMWGTSCYFANPSSIHALGKEAGNKLNEVRVKIARLLGVVAHEVYFAGTSTESLNIAICGIVEKYFYDTGNRAHIIVSPYEHSAVKEILNNLNKKGMIEFDEIPLSPKGHILLDNLTQMLKPNTVLVICMHVSNELGVILPVRKIRNIINDYHKSLNLSNANSRWLHYPYTLVDASQSGRELHLDPRGLGADIFIFNGSKIYGPKGIACAVIKEGVKISPFLNGGGQERGLRSGTESVMLATGMTEALKFVSQNHKKENERLDVLGLKFRELIKKAVPECVIYDVDKDRRLNSFINIGFPGLQSDEMIIRLSSYGVYVSHMSACKSADGEMSYTITKLGANDKEAKENIRITLGLNTTMSDIIYTVKQIQIIYYKYHK